MRKWKRLELFIAAALAFAAFCFVQDETITAGPNEIRVTKVGLPFSPWLELTRKTTNQKTDWKDGNSFGGSFNSSFSSSWNMEFFSWSFAVLFVAVVFLLLALKKQPVQEIQSPAPPK